MAARVSLSPLFTWRSAVVDSDLPPTTRHVALTLSLHMNERGGSAFPSQATLGRETGLHPETVRDHLRMLREGGWLVVLRGASRARPVEYGAQIPGGVENPTFTQKGGVEDCGKVGVENPPEDVIEDVRPSQVLRTCANGQPKDRPRDLLWDALTVELGEPATKSERGRRNKALVELREVEAAPADIQRACREYRRRWPGIELTATALAGNWSSLTNGAVALDPEERARRAMAAVYERARRAEQGGTDAGDPG